jgi:hypothetical protein
VLRAKIRNKPCFKKFMMVYVLVCNCKLEIFDIRAVRP